jgi:hypothetical protein
MGNESERLRVANGMALRLSRIAEGVAGQGHYLPCITVPV